MLKPWAIRFARLTRVNFDFLQAARVVLIPGSCINRFASSARRNTGSHRFSCTKIPMVY